MAVLQLAIDTTATDEALRLAGLTHPYFDIAEIGTPLLIEEGLAALEAIRARYPDKQVLADTKIADAGHLEATSAFRRGAHYATVLGVADDETIRGALQAAHEHDAHVMIDMIHVNNPVERAQHLEQLGVHDICLHTAYDLQDSDVDPLVHLRNVRAAVQCRVAIAGGINLHNVHAALDMGADIVVVGGGITSAPDARKAAKDIQEIIKGGDRNADTA